MSRLLRRVLIANRGEIAVRIIRACREAGIESIAVFSDADRHAFHAQMADTAVRIGPAPPLESYLSIPAILDAARQTRADAVHPGYGFLSERAAFAEACEAAGVTFIGPPAAVIAAMGSKIAARDAVRRAGVPVVPGETPEDQSDKGVEAAVRHVGLPALIKASAGGGGKGMRVIREPREIAGGIRSARAESTSAFGDGTLYVERLIERPHHVEVQIMADHHGHVVHLFERECSVQRRHQKIIEESPSPTLTPAVRSRLTAAAVAAARAVGYRNAGTIEFLVEGSGDEATFFFLEMNTRLQVEHAVTEAVTGIDLVRAQLAVAAGEPLPWTQDTIIQRGHAIEARVYAEDPARGFLPQSGRLAVYREPRHPGVRVDAGVRQGDEVSVYYDPMIAKVIAYAETRDQSIQRLAAALADFPILGIETNISFLLALLESAEFRGEGARGIDTWFLERHPPTARVIDPQVLQAMSAALAAATSGRRPTVARAEASSFDDPWSSLPAGDAAIPALLESVDDDAYRVVVDERAHVVYVAPRGDGWSAFSNGYVVHADVESQHAQGGAAREASQSRTLIAPMPARVTRLTATVGAQVAKGETLIVLEAMKMQLNLTALSDGTVAAVHCAEGELVPMGHVLVELE